MKGKALFACLSVMMLWGLLLPLVKLGYGVFEISTTGDIIAFAGLRFLVCGLIMVLICLIRNPKSFQDVHKHLGVILVMGLFAVVLHYSFSYVGLNMTDGSKTGILKQMGSVFFISFSAIFFPDDKMTRNKLCGLLLGLGGILVINLGSAGLEFHIGDVLLLTSSFCTVASNIIGKKVFRHVEPIVAAGVSQLSGGMILMAFGLAVGGKFSIVFPTNLPQMGIMAVILVASLVSYCLWYLAVQKEKLSRLYILKFAEPLCATFFSWILLGENIFQLRYLAAFLMISGGILLANRKTENE